MGLPGGPNSLDLESQFAAGMLGSRASLPSNGELSPVVHSATGNGDSCSAMANGHVHGNGGLDAAALRQPPSYVADGGRMSPAPSLPPPPLLPGNPFAAGALPAGTAAAGADSHHAAGQHGGVESQQSLNGPVESQQLHSNSSAPVDFLREHSGSLARDDAASTWPEPNTAFQVRLHADADFLMIRC